MFCIYCGASLPEVASYCRECGRQQRTDTSPDEHGQQEAAWEHCDIQFEQVSAGWLFSGPRGRFYGWVSGQTATYRAAQSEEVPLKYLSSGEIWPDLSETELRSVLERLERHLIGDGWVPLGQTGPLSWQRRFLRPYR